MADALVDARRSAAAARGNPAAARRTRAQRLPTCRDSACRAPR